MHDVCVCAQSPKVARGLMVRAYSVTVTLRVRARDGEWISIPFFLKVTNTFALPSWPRLDLVRRLLILQCHLWQYDVSVM